MTDTPTLDQVLTLATRLAPADKLRLIERLVPQVVQVLPVAALELSAPSGVAWDAFLALADDPEVQAPTAQDSAVLVSEMRR